MASSMIASVAGQHKVVIIQLFIYCTPKLFVSFFVPVPFQFSILCSSTYTSALPNASTEHTYPHPPLATQNTQCNFGQGFGERNCGRVVIIVL